MGSSMLPNEFLDGLVAEHRSWLLSFDPQCLSNWNKILGSDEEAALAEAGVRRMLQSIGVRVEPNKNPSGEGPDFQCESSECKFRVEVTHLSIAKVTEVTGLVERQTGCRAYGTLNNAIFNACRGKAEQCGGSQYPTLLAIATFHSDASALCFGRPHVDMLLTGETKITWNVNVRTGEQVGDPYQTTELRSATFLRPDRTQEIGFARSSISALLLCGLGAHFRDRRGIWRPRVVGILHPNPAREFCPTTLPSIEFAYIQINRASRQLRVKWQGEEDGYSHQ
jgi:hypothetical protein